jgi:hypothetical protein
LGRNLRDCMARILLIYIIALFLTARALKHH